MEWRIEELPWLPTPPEDFRARCKLLDPASASWAQAVQFLASHALNSAQLTQLAKCIAKAPPEKKGLSRFTLGFLSNTTTELIAPCLVAAVARYGIMLEVIATPFDQVIQQAVDPHSLLNASAPNAVLLALDHRALPFEQGSDAAAEYAKTIRAAIRQHSGAPVIVQNIARPPETLFGNFERCLGDTLQRKILEYNRVLENSLGEESDYLLDVAGLAETIGLSAWHDPSQWHVAKLPFAQAFVPLYAEQVARIIAALRGKTRKCLVLDLDNTLWGGVIGDDGVGGIVLGQGNPRGEAFVAIQRMALDLRSRGIVLAVSSKNDNDTARTPFRQHPDMLLKEEHIAVFQANWQDKASNLKAIAETLNIGTDALVFLDDNPAERAYVRGAMPEVGIPELPADPALYPRALLFGGYFEAVTFSREDRERAESYQANAQRAQLQAQVGDVGQFLTSLNMVIHFAPFDIPGRSRIAQLVNKSNQFNLTTRRYSENDIATIERDPGYFTLQVRLLDKFGDNGMISVIICRDAGEAWEIDTWVMSCRVLGRRVEEAVLHEMARVAGMHGKSAITGEYIDSGRNKLVREHYRKLGFVQAGGDDAHSRWRLDIVGIEMPVLPFTVEYAAMEALAVA